MISATLCSTNTDEPWAANVQFSVSDNKLKTTLKPEYTHFQNLSVNQHAAIVYKYRDVEIIMKAEAEIQDHLTGETDFTVIWLRVVRHGTIQDSNKIDEIKKQIATFLVDDNRLN